MTPTSRHIGDMTTPAQRLRLKWAESLQEQLTWLKWTPKQFRYELDKAGCTVTRQAVEQWLAGETAPRPHHQAVIAKVLRTAPHLLFSVDAA